MICSGKNTLEKLRIRSLHRLRFRPAFALVPLVVLLAPSFQAHASEIKEIRPAPNQGECRLERILRTFEDGPLSNFLYGQKHIYRLMRDDKQTARVELQFRRTNYNNLIRAWTHKYYLGAHQINAKVSSSSERSNNIILYAEENNIFNGTSARHTLLNTAVVAVHYPSIEGKNILWGAARSWCRSQ